MRRVGVIAGSIPAYAGDPSWTVVMVACVAVYPRLRGGSHDGVDTSCDHDGLSPPTRGILNAAVRSTIRDRSIPAYAGDPDCGAAFNNAAAVYPRLRGGSRFPNLRRFG